MRSLSVGGRFSRPLNRTRMNLWRFAMMPYHSNGLGLAMWMLDTNICSYLLRKRPVSALERFYASPLVDLRLSAIVVAELRYGAFRSESPPWKHTKALRLSLG
jgi:hypothetical protein